MSPAHERAPIAAAGRGPGSSRRSWRPSGLGLVSRRRPRSCGTGPRDPRHAPGHPLDRARRSSSSSGSGTWSPAGCTWPTSWSASRAGCRAPGSSRATRLIGVDMSKAEVEDRDEKARTATIVLPRPAVISARVNHEKSQQWDVKSRGWIPLAGSLLGDRPAMEKQAMLEAQRLVERAAAVGGLHGDGAPGRRGHARRSSTAASAGRSRSAGSDLPADIGLTPGRQRQRVIPIVMSLRTVRAPGRTIPRSPRGHRSIRGNESTPRSIRNIRRMGLAARILRILRIGWLSRPDIAAIRRGRVGS